LAAHPIAAHATNAINWGLVAGKTLTYSMWDDALSEPAGLPQ
jgi:hypothetical protein